MDYIVLDMEWNQPWPGSPSSKKPAGSAIRGEIIQVGAVRVLEDGTVADEFQVMVRPKVYRHLNRRVSKLTGIKETRLREEGVPFPEAVERFRGWCSENITLEAVFMVPQSCVIFQFSTLQVQPCADQRRMIGISQGVMWAPVGSHSRATGTWIWLPARSTGSS